MISLPEKGCLLKTNKQKVKTGSSYPEQKRHLVLLVKLVAHMCSTAVTECNNLHNIFIPDAFSNSAAVKSDDDVNEMF